MHSQRAGRPALASLPAADAAIREICAKLPRVLARWDEVIELAGKARDRNEGMARDVHEGFPNLFLWDYCPGKAP